MKKKIAVVALSLLMAFNTVGSAFAVGSVAHGDLSVYKSGKLADKLSGQNPVDEGSLLVCDGKCMVKSEGISLVAADQAKFAIQNEEDAFNLFVRGGTINYVITDNSRKIAFHTPDGSYSVAEVIFNAESSSVVRGYVQVNDKGQTEIAVTEGRMVFATADGMKPVDANHKIVLAEAMKPPGPEGGGLSTGATLGLVGGGLVAGGVIWAITDDDDDTTTPPASTEPERTPDYAPTPTGSPSS